jgi:alkyldihydroxyacetonephosphate synthase
VSLICGTEGSLGVVTAATLAVTTLRDEHRICAAMPSLADGLIAQRRLVHGGIPLSLVRLYNAAESVAICPPGLLTATECLLVVTTQGEAGVAAAAAAAIERTVAAAGGRPLDEEAADAWFAHRYAAPGFMADRNATPGTVFDTIEVALPWATAAAAADEIERLVGPLSVPLHLHFSHVYPTGACLYAILRIEAEDDASARRRWADSWSLTLDITERHGGTIAHHHGIGAMRAERYARSAEGILHRRIAAALDPDGVLRAPLVGGGHG